MPKHNERTTLVIATALAKKLTTQVAVLQSNGHTEWHDGERGYAILGHDIPSPKQTFDRALAQLAPRKK